MITEITFEVDDDPENPPKEYTADITIYSFGSGPSWYDPGEPPEWDISHIYDPSGKEVPYHLPLRLIRDRFEAWFNGRKPKPRINPEWERLAALAEKHMEDHFDWYEAERDEAEYQAELNYDLWHQR